MNTAQVDAGNRISSKTTINDLCEALLGVQLGASRSRRRDQRCKSECGKDAAHDLVLGIGLALRAIGRMVLNRS
jgi:hypothetical protein